MPLKCQIPVDETYDLPEGRYRAQLVKVRPQIKQSNRGQSHLVRLLFEVEIPSVAVNNKIPMAGRNFILDLKRQSDLRGFPEARTPAHPTRDRQYFPDWLLEILADNLFRESP